MLLLAACSAATNRQGDAVGTSANASAVASAQGAAEDSGRTLTEAQLLAAGLTLSELPSGFTFIPVPDGRWAAAQAMSPMPAPNTPCQPLIDLIFGLSQSDVEVSVGYQGANAVDVGRIRLASYGSGRARDFFAAVKRSVSKCPGFTYTTYVGTVYATFELLAAPGFGDDSASFGMIIHDNEIAPHMERFDYMRVGHATAMVDLMGFGMPPPPLSRDLLAAQVSKLRSAQS